MYKSNEWNIVIGMEVHAQIISNSKLFSTSPCDFGAPPNENVSFIDAAFPGMLPTLNKHCIDQAIKTGIGINGTINMRSDFDRKNYMYPDLPQGYQISQFFTPLVVDGFLDIESDNVPLKRIRIERIHIEQDAGKNIHDKDPNFSLIDLNRAGVGLMEIVTKPDMTSSEEACLFLSKLRTILRYLKTCNGNMEEGSLRADINVSVNRPGEPLGVRVELKNINSLKFISQAIECESSRQIQIIESGGIISQETRLFNSVTGETKSLRLKENAQDYRYFNDPDLPTLVITDDRLNIIRSSMPELPEAKKTRYINDFGLSHYDANVLTSEPETAYYFEDAIKCFRSLSDGSNSNIKLISNWITSELFAKLNADQLTIDQSKISSKALAELVLCIVNQTISGKIAKEVFQLMWDSEKSANEIIVEHGLTQITNEKDIEQTIKSVLENNPETVAEFRSGKDRLFGFFVGLVMKATGGKANPPLLNDLLKKYLNQQ